METRKKVVRPGDTVIAYIDDMTSCVGLVTDSSEQKRTIILILGWFTKYETTPNADVFARQEIHPFPSYKEMPVHNMVPYDFEMEIRLCADRDDAWWKSLEPPCGGNLVTRYFHPKQIAALSLIDITKYFLTVGGDMEYRPIRYMDDRNKLLLWAVLHYHFPDKVPQPPEIWDCKRSNIRYHISIENLSVTTTFR